MDRPKMILLCGIPGSGKSTYAKNNASKNDVILSSDSIREELYGNESIQGNPAEVFSLMQKRAVEALNNGKTVWYDATNITRKDRASIISVCPKFVHIECHIIWAPIETCIERDAARERTVGKEVIDRMVKRFQMPYYDEGIEDIYIIDTINISEEEINKRYDSIFENMKMPHDNPHHQLSILDHCAEAALYCDQNHYYDVWYAALLHDCGKPYCKSFINNNGEITDIAHYYGHQSVSAYIMCGLASYKWTNGLCISYMDNIDSIWLVSTHMDPFLNTKYYNNLPPYLKTMVDKLHECDLAAH